MITKREQIANATAPYVIEKKLFLEVARWPLKEVAEKFAKNVVILDEEQMQKFKKAQKISEIRRQCGKMGGRPKLPELTPEEVSSLPVEEQKRYKMRMWKRNSRQRSNTNG